ncbi:DNA repair protein RecO [Deinococcus grandis]|uniref:DNA repair protein RecO n=1 Tax=Deinococcus grandis TaxID=57498 RepID=A0A100HKP0_9DEIO|nr:hypothetical protein DEGR_07160 [Deinococcus grandis]GAQ22510.1 DNA repair protein RecO [Deinococcus grandis]
MQHTGAVIHDEDRGAPGRCGGHASSLAARVCQRLHKPAPDCEHYHPALIQAGAAPAQLAAILRT